MSHLPNDSKARKARPIYEGVLAYFPDAIVAVSEVSHQGNIQHNGPDAPLHWDRSKSTDHADCIARHLLDHGTPDDDGIRHTAKLAWRALALLQEEIEAEQGLVPFAPGTPREKMLRLDKSAPTRPAQEVFEEIEREYPELLAGPVPFPDDFIKASSRDFERVTDDTIPPGQRIIKHDDRMDALEYAMESDVSDGPRLAPGEARVLGIEISQVSGYIGGPMTGYEFFNFPAFDEARDRGIDLGLNIISPADLDREEDGIDPINNWEEAERVAKETPAASFAARDLMVLLSLNPDRGDFIAMLPGWEKSTGAAAEFMVARWLGLKIVDAYKFEPLDPSFVNYSDLCTSIHKYLQGGRER
jgi:hypothetical protein